MLPYFPSISCNYWMENIFICSIFCFHSEYLLRIDGAEFKIDKDMVAVKATEKILHVEEIIPNVIEPSFGIGRIMYAMFEHNFFIRKDDEQRTVRFFCINYYFFIFVIQVIFFFLTFWVPRNIHCVHYVDFTSSSF